MAKPDEIEDIDQPSTLPAVVQDVLDLQVVQDIQVAQVILDTLDIADIPAIQDASVHMLLIRVL